MHIFYIYREGVMSLLRSFSFGIENGLNEIPTDVLSIFSDLSDKQRSELIYASEIVEAGMRGRLDTTRVFNLKAYTAEITKRKKMKQNETKEVYMVSDFEDEAVSSTSLYQKTITQEYASTHTAEKMRDAYEVLADNDELVFAVQTIKELNLELAAMSGVDLIQAMKSYIVNGIQASADIIKRVCDQYPVVGEYVYIILNCKEPFTELFGDCI